MESQSCSKDPLKVLVSYPRDSHGTPVLPRGPSSALAPTCDSKPAHGTLSGSSSCPEGP